MGWCHRAIASQSYTSVTPPIVGIHKTKSNHAWSEPINLGSWILAFAGMMSRVNHICRRIASNQMLLNFGRTRSPVGPGHEIGTV